jgi:uncharacterized membrane protein
VPAHPLGSGFIGYPRRVVLPALGESPDRAAGTAMLVAIERRALPLVLISVVLFIATGTWLLVVNDRYAGLGDVFANTWATLMLLKHLAVILLVASASRSRSSSGGSPGSRTTRRCRRR